MPSEVTKKSNVIIPQVMGDMIEAKLTAKAKLVPYAKLDTTLVGVPGDTKTVPCWDYVGDAVEVAEGGEVETKKLTASSTQFTIKKAQQSVGITEESINSGMGDPVGAAEQQLAQAIYSKVDNDLVAAALSSTNAYDGTTANIAYSGIVDAEDVFNEEDDTDKVMFIHPKQKSKLRKDSNYINATEAGYKAMVSGEIGTISGVRVKSSKKVPLIKYEVGISTDTVVTADNQSTYAVCTWDAANKKVITPAVGTYVKAVANNYYMCPIIKLEPSDTETEYDENELAALTIFLKADTSVDHEWFPKKQQHDITATKYYGVALTNAAKVVVAKFKA